ncbi:oocyte-secreted protein 3-like isoform X2 [Cavia porcellus]|uniref:oocyte-secreted protein 3-like isoform X2 n=1 Tax=Cavia porcellus TaxID=10141 RepID=UPI002FE184B8
MASMMKALLRIEESLLLLLSFLWICSGQERVSVQCTRFNFHAIAKTTMFGADQLVYPDELSLGTGCGPSLVLLDEVHFSYPVNLCGIKMLVYMDGVTFHSWLNYIPRNGLYTAEVELECQFPNSSGLRNDTLLSSRFIQKPVLQQWFLVQYRYCQKCGKSHFRDNWSTLFYGPRSQQSS